MFKTHTLMWYSLAGYTVLLNNCWAGMIDYFGLTCATGGIYHAISCSHPCCDVLKSMMYALYPLVQRQRGTQLKHTSTGRHSTSSSCVGSCRAGRRSLRQPPGAAAQSRRSAQRPGAQHQHAPFLHHAPVVGLRGGGQRWRREGREGRVVRYSRTHIAGH